MPVTVPETSLRHARASFRSLASPDGAERRGMVKGVQGEVKLLLKEQFTKGIGPDGAPLQETVKGDPALVSRKLANIFQAQLERGVLHFSAKSKRDMLTAHNSGYIFPARQRAANQQFLTFNSRGRLTKNSRALNKKGEARRSFHQTFAQAHTVGERVLPQRPITPEGELPPRYVAPIDRVVTGGMLRWHEKAAG
jgi:hypothetical protein